jgi:hypothetical protein
MHKERFHETHRAYKLSGFWRDDVNCKLCLKEAPLAMSHIIPEFVFTGMYDRKHRYLQVSDVDAGKIELGQKGFREKLLCFECEALLNNRCERHSQRLFKDTLPPSESPISRRIRIPNLDPRVLQLFLLSVLWRAGVSSLPVFEHVTLGRHEERLRVILLSDNSESPLDYPCVVVPLLLEGKHLRDWIVQPAPARIDGHRCYRFVFGGFLFVLFVSSHNLPAEFQRTCLADTGRILLYPKELGEFRFLRDVWNRAKDSTRDAVTSFGT